MSMNLGDIIEAVRNGQRPGYEDLRYAICAMDALMTFDRMALTKLTAAELAAIDAGGKKPFMVNSAQWQLGERQGRVSRAMQKPPKEYVGWNNDPDNPEFLKRRQQSIKLVERIVAKADAAAQKNSS